MKKKKPANLHEQSNYLSTFAIGAFFISLLMFVYRLMQANHGAQAQPLNLFDASAENLKHTQPLSVTFGLAANASTPLNEQPPQWLQCEGKIESLRSKSFLKKLIHVGKKHFPTQATHFISIDPALLINTDSKIESMRNKYEEAFLQMLDESSFFPNTVPTGELNMALTAHKNVYNDNIRATYLTVSNTILLMYPFDATIEECKKALKNTFFYHQIVATNTLRGINIEDKSKMPLPFLTKKGEVSDENLKHFESTLIAAGKKIESYQKIISGNQAEWPLDLLLFSQQFKDYTPAVYRLSEEQFKEAVQNNVLTAPNKKGYFTSGNAYPTHLPTCYGQKAQNKIAYRHAENNKPESKMIALFGDLSFQLDSLKSKLKALEEGEINDKNIEKGKLLTEFGAALAELPTPMQKMLFPDFYGFMCQFFSFTPAPRQSRFFQQPEKMASASDEFPQEGKKLSK